MRVMMCRRCGGEINRETGRCARCGQLMDQVTTRRHRILGGIAVVAAVLFLGVTFWVYMFSGSGLSEPRSLPPCEADAVIAAVKNNSPFVTWAQQAGTSPITELRDIRAGAWDSARHLQYCTATAITETGSYAITYGLSPQKQSAAGWTVNIFPDSHGL